MKEKKLFRTLGCLHVLIRCLTLPKRLKLAHKGVGVTQQIPSLVLICDAKTWSLENRNKLFQTLDCLYALIGCLTLYKRWET